VQQGYQRDIVIGPAALSARDGSPQRCTRRAVDNETGAGYYHSLPRPRSEARSMAKQFSTIAA